MKIRAITGFADPGWPIQTARLKALGRALRDCRDALQSAGYEVQTLRLATPPPLEMEPPVPVDERPAFARALEAEAFIIGIDYAAVGPALPQEEQGYHALAPVLAATENIFTSGLYAEPSMGLSLHAARGCAEAIREISAISPDGFGNLRFAALVNVPAGTPFFPAAYHRGGPPAVALACESASLAVQALAEETTLSAARRRLVSTLEVHATTLTQVVRRALREADVRFAGLDLSFAPFPEPGRSLGTAMEAFGASATGLAGSAAAAAFLADCLDRADFERAGFCGLFLPVLEDSVLAARAAEGHLTLKDLLLFATLCGAGLDTIPLPGDISVDALMAILIDLGAIGLRHLKPLTARLMPLPGKVAGDEVHFDFPYFADSRVLEPYARPLEGLLAATRVLDIGPLQI